MKIAFVLNGSNVKVEVSPIKRLLDILREDLGDDAMKAGCRSGECGNCLVLLDGELVNSCLVPAFRAHNRKIQTPDGLVRVKLYNEIEQGLSGLLCAFCSRSTTLSIFYLLSRLPFPTEKQIKNFLSGILCPCAGLQATSEAIQRLSSTRKT